MRTNITSLDNLGSEYMQHPIFEQLDYYSKFYHDLSYSIMHWSSSGTRAVLNLDTYTYSSIEGTLNSIKEILLKGRINDAYTLLRKYYDSTIINVYTNLFLENNYGIENIIVKQIDGWLNGTEKLPTYREMSQYIKQSPKLTSVTELLSKKDNYKKIRERCNDNTHYNFYHNVMLNDNKIYNPHRVKYLSRFNHDIDALFIQHFAYIFYLNEHYMMSSDYMDYYECGVRPEEGSEYWVANFIQEVFDNIVKVKRPDIAQEIKNKTKMNLK